LTSSLEVYAVYASSYINVRSVVGRFLEHARVFYFENSDEQSELFLSSADLMPRNLRKRIEQCTPILDNDIKLKILSNLNTYLDDDSNAWLMQADGQYVRALRNDVHEEPINAQNILLNKYSEEY